MSSEYVERIGTYIRKVEDEWKSGRATEHTYRPMLKELVEALLPRVTAVNEPKHIECGAPDYLLRRGTDILGFIEAKDIGDGDLDGRTVNKEQFNRYKDSLDNLCFTDYLDFHFYDHGDFVDSVRIAEPKGDRIVMANDAELERFFQLLGHFADAKPQHITSPSRLAQLMAGKARLLADGVRRYLGREENAGSMLAQQMEAFRNVLIHDIDADSFADIFAQTVTYGMFAARLHDSTPEDFSRAEAATLIPKTNPLLRQMFQYIAMDTDDSIEWIVDDLVSLFAAVDVEKLMRGYGKDTQKSDPLLHFYEDFLAAYDPKLRKSRGVWYTPKPVVDFIVRSIDSILTRDFHLPGGLADHSKTKVKVVNDAKVKNRDKAFVEREVHRVQILDPAAGTGTFLAETVKLIHSKVSAAMGEGAWQGYVAENLLPRLNGFEILMASYAMAHLKLDLLLAETGYEHKTNERLRVFLTNSLEPYDKETGTLFAAALSQEANEANFIKRDCPVMVVLGNPPYSVSSANKGEWVENLVADYKKDLNERNIQPLSDDYIKFLRLGQYYVNKNGEGVLAYISNNSFLDGLIHRQMRKSLLESFDEIYILNLHGNARKKETAPDGSKDENVFDIMQGVSINIFVKRNGAAGVRALPRDSLATVHYADLYGVREDKYAYLDANGIESVKWQTLALQEPYYFFVPKDFGLQEEYEKGFKIDELCDVNTGGVKTHHDKELVSFDRFVSECNHTYDYRIFDKRWIDYDLKKVVRHRYEVMRHMLYENLALLIVMNSRRGEKGNYFVSQTIVGKDCVSPLDTCTAFPLYLYNDNMGKVEKVPNFDAAIYAKICAAVNDAPCLQASANTVGNKTKGTGLSVLSYIQGEGPAPDPNDVSSDSHPENPKDGRLTPFVNNRIASCLNAVNRVEGAGKSLLAYYREHELGKTWYDVADPREFLSMKPIRILVDETADRKTVKSVFRQMTPVRNLVDGRCVNFPVAAAKKLRLLREVNVPGIAAELGRLFAMSRLAWSEKEAEIPNHKLHRNAYAYHHYIAKMSVEAGEYYVRFAVREDTSVDARNELHDAIISNIVIYKAKGAELSGPGLSRVEDSTPFVDNKIALFLSAVNGVEKRE